MPLVLRTIKGAELTHLEVDGNFAERFTSVAHGWVIGQGVKPAWSLSQADDVPNIPSGIVAFVEDADTVWIATKDGTIVTWTGHGLGSAGTVIYTSQSTLGGFTSTRPESGVRYPFLRVISVNSVMIERGALEVI